MKLLVILAAIAVDARRSRRPYSVKDSDAETRRGIAKLGWSLVLGEQKDNAIISPVSIAGALHMLAAGAVGDTREEILKEGLGMTPEMYGRKGVFDHKLLVKAYDSITSDLMRYGNVSIFNGLYVHSPVEDLIALKDERAINPMYASIIGKNYIKRIGEIKDLDFANDPKAAQDYINGKVREATHGVIDDIVGNLDSNTLSIIVSAIYYKSKWGKDFQKVHKNTVKNDFNYCFADLGPEDDCQDVTWIKTKTGLDNNILYAHDEADNVRYFSVPMAATGDKRYQFYLNIYHPLNGLDSIAGWDWTKFGSLADEALHQASSDNHIALHMPEFNVKYEANLVEHLQKLGVESAFDPGFADLSYMLPYADGAYVSTIDHSASIEVTEEGIIAAAATAVNIVNRGGGWKTTEFYLNSPFYFTISYAKNRSDREKLAGTRGASMMQVQMFMGKVAKIGKK